jgi:hypothetical protein
MEMFPGAPTESPERSRERIRYHNRSPGFGAALRAPRLRRRDGPGRTRRPQPDAWRQSLQGAMRRGEIGCNLIFHLNVSRGYGTQMHRIRLAKGGDNWRSVKRNSLVFKGVRGEVGAGGHT